MIKSIFIDTDIILDVALARAPFFAASKVILAMAETNKVIAKMTSNCVANVYYILRKIGGNTKAQEFLLQLIKYVSVITIDHQNVIEALGSKMKDFEDALQYCSARDNQCEYIITRNTEDYKESKIQVMLPEDFIKLFQEF